MADEIYEVGYEVEGADRAAAEIQSITGAQERLTRAAGSQSRAASDQARTAQRLNATVEQGGRKWGELAGAVGNVGAVFAQTNPALGQAGSLIGAMGTASSALTGSMGLLGVGIAAVTTAAGLLLPLLQSTESEMSDIADQARRADDAVRGLADAMNERNRLQNAQAGTASVEDIQAQLTEAEQQLEAATGRMQALRAEGQALIRSRLGNLEAVAEARERFSEMNAEVADLQRAIGPLEERVQSLRQGLSTAQSVGQGDTGEDPTEALRARRAAEDAARAEFERRRRSGAAAAAQERQAEQEAMQRSWLEDVAFERRVLDERLEAHRAYMDQLDQIQAQVNQNRRDRLNQEREQRQEAFEHQVEIANRERALYAEQQNQMVERANQWRDVQNNIVQASMNEVIALSGQMVRQLIQASKLGADAFMAQLDSFLEATAIEYTLKSLAEVANAVAAAARYDYAAAAQHGVAAALAGAVATATGVASIGIQTPSGATGGGGGPAQVGAGATPAGGDGGNITVNLFAPQAVFTEAERGQIVAEGLRAARREGGPGAVRG